MSLRSKDKCYFKRIANLTDVNCRALTLALPKALSLRVQSLANGMAEGLITLPDTVFILNVNDVSFCADPGYVPGQPQVEFDGTHGSYTRVQTSADRDASCMADCAR